MKRQRWTKMVVDVLMTLVLLILMGYQIWGEAAHEWAGAAMLVLFILHHILNRGWYRGILRGKYGAMRAVQTGVDILLLAAMVIQMYSGILLSRHVFAFLPIHSGMALARRLHILGSYWGFTLMSVHLGLHWQMLITKITGSRKEEGTSKAGSAVRFLAGLMSAGYGLFVFLERDIPTYLFLRTEFVFLDYGEGVTRFYLDYLCMMGLWVFLAHYGAVLFRKRGASKRQG